MFKYGVASLIWTEDFSKDGVPLIAKAKSLGFDVIDISMTNTEKFPSKAVKKAALAYVAASEDAHVEPHAARRVHQAHAASSVGLPRGRGRISPPPGGRAAAAGRGGPREAGHAGPPRPAVDRA